MEFVIVTESSFSTDKKIPLIYAPPAKFRTVAEYIDSLAMVAKERLYSELSDRERLRLPFCNMHSMATAARSSNPMIPLKQGLFTVGIAQAELMITS